MKAGRVHLKAGLQAVGETSVEAASLVRNPEVVTHQIAVLV